MTAQLAPPPVFRAFDGLGFPLFLGRLTTYQAGTLIPQATYIDSSQATPNTNPIILNARGECALWLDPTKSYKLALTDQFGNNIPGWPVDNISGGSLSPSGSIIPTITNLFNLGSPSFTWANAYFGATGLALIDAGGNAGFYARTAAEIAASVTPTDYFYPPGDVRRYGAVGNGSADDTTAITNALLVASLTSPGNCPVIFAQGFKFKITSYIQVYSNTTIYLYSTLQLTARQSGLFCNGANNVGIYGFKIGQIQDTTVLATYAWNTAAFNLAPAIHIRSSNHVTIDGLNVNYCAQGIFISNANANYNTPGTPFFPTQAYPTDVKVRDCTTTFCEWSGIANLSSYDSGYYNNYVYRCGDGGLWMMGSIRGSVVGNTRTGPQTVYADTLTFGQNSAAHPTTWNDVQGMEFEGCHDLLIADNTVSYIQGEAIDIKQTCNRVLCTGNRLSYNEQFSIVVREGDSGDTNQCWKTTISNNTISNHGYTMFSTTPQTSIAAAISVSSDYITVITDNTIYSYQTTPGIFCGGPGQYLANNYGGNPQQASLVVTGNSIEFMAANPFDTSELSFTASTLGAIIIAGQYTTIKCDNNHIRTDRYFYSDTRINSSPAISLTVVFQAWLSTTAYVAGNVVYTGAGGAIYTCILANTNQPPPNATYWSVGAGAAATGPFYPSSGSVSNNEIVGWGFTGIDVQGQRAMGSSGLVVNGNVISGAGGWGINLKSTNYAVCNGNNIAQNNNSVTGGYAGINIAGVAGTPIQGMVASGNSVYGGWNIGGNNMAYCIQVAICSDINLTNNKMANFVTGALNFITATGNLVLSGSTGFPRTGAGTPNGSVTSFYIGEQYFDTTGLKWWAASTFQSTVWTQLTN